MHHSTVDGMSGAALLSVLFDLEVDPGPEPEPPELVGDPHIPSSAELISEAMAARVFRPFEMTRDILRTGQRLLNVRRVRNEPEHRAPQSKAALPLSAPRTSFNGTLTRRRQVALSAIGLADVKRLKNATGTTVNDVVLAICTGALRRFLVDGDELPDKPLVAVVPVSVQPDDGAPTARTRSPRCSCSSRPTSTTRWSDWWPSGRAPRGRRRSTTRSGPTCCVNWAEHATPNTFAAAARLYSRMRLADRHRPMANLIVSNVPGPGFPLYLAGAEMVAGFPLGPVMDGLGLNITIMSYRGVLYWGIISCPETMPRCGSWPPTSPCALDELLAAGDSSRPSSAPTRRPSRRWPRGRTADAGPADRASGRVPASRVRSDRHAIEEAPAHTRIGAAERPVAGRVGQDGVEAGHHERAGGAGLATTSWGGPRRPPTRCPAGGQPHRRRRRRRVGGQDGEDPVVGRVGHEQLGAVGGDGERRPGR